MSALGQVQALTGSGIKSRSAGRLGTIVLFGGLYPGLIIVGAQTSTRSDSSPDAARLLVAIPIAVFKIIVAGTASSSPFQRRPKIDRHHAGILFTFRWNLRSRCAGNREHHAPSCSAEHDTRNAKLSVMRSRSSTSLKTLGRPDSYCA